MEHSDAWALQAARQHDPDWTLDLLIKLIDETGMPFPMTLLTAGYFVKGVAVRVENWADHLDAVMDANLAAAAGAFERQQQGMGVEALGSVGATAGDVEKWRAEWPDKGWRRQVDERRASEAETRKQLDDSGAPRPLEEFPDELARKAVGLELPRRALSISDASIIGAAGTVKMPFVRVAVSQIAAWWPGQLSFEGDREESA
jgi:hypothetical protein